MKRISGLLCVVFLLIAGLSAAGTLDDQLDKADNLTAAGKLGEAVTLLKQCVQENPESSKAHAKLGVAMGRKSGEDFKSGDMTSAMAEVNQSFSELDKAILLDETNVEARISYGIMGLQVPPFFGKLNPSVEHLEAARKILEMHPAKENEAVRVTVYRWLGEGYKRQGKIREASVTWKIALAITEEGELAEAVKQGLNSLEAAEETSPSSEAESSLSIDELMEKGQGHLKAKEYPEAAACFKEIMKRDPKNGKVQLLLVQAIANDAEMDYDERVYEKQDTRTHLAFDLVREMNKAVMLNPENKSLRLQYAMTCLSMPFFVGKTDEGMEILKNMSEDTTLPDSLKQEVLFGLGFGHAQKATAYWASVVKADQNSERARQVCDYYGLRKSAPQGIKKGPHVEVTFHLGFQDELAPQTAIWIEDAKGKFIKTLYVSGFAGHAREKQVTLAAWGEAAQFETDGTTSASIDWGKHTYVWDLTDHNGKKVKDGTYKVKLEVSWWPTYRYAMTEAEINVAKKDDRVVTQKEPFIPLFKVQYIK